MIVAVHAFGSWWTVEHPDRGVCLPGGKVDRGESVSAAASRELFEETGIEVQPYLLDPFATGIVPGEVDYQVTAFLSKVSPVPYGTGEDRLWPGLRDLAELRAAPWAMQHDFHRAVYDRLEVEQARRGFQHRIFA